MLAINYKIWKQLSVVVPTYNPNILEADAGGSQIQDQHGVM